MPVEEAIDESIEYKLVFVEPASRNVLVPDDFGGYRLPRVRIPQGTRPAEQLRKVSKKAWDLDVLVLDFLDSEDGSPCCAVAELLTSKNELRCVPPAKVMGSELSERQRVHVADLLFGRAHSPFSQVGWIDEAVTWMETATQRKLASKSDIEQYNAGGAFALIRFHTEGDGYYWLKATGEPNAHELSITHFLSEVCGEYLPVFISSKPSWNAWLMSGESSQITEFPSDPSKLFRLLEDAVESLAEVQRRTAGRGLELLRAGAFDHGIEAFQRHSEALFDYLEEAMSLQTSSRVPRLERARLREIRGIFDDVCGRIEDLGLPAMIVHGDLNHSNILSGSGHCQFIDWCEAYLGNPLISLQHLILLNKVENPAVRAFMNRLLKDRYRNVWRTMFDATAIENGFIYMPFLAIASSMYGRGDWLHSEHRNDPRRQSYTRSLARHLDRAAREPELLEALCL